VERLGDVLEQVAEFFAMLPTASTVARNTSCKASAICWIAKPIALSTAAASAAAWKNAVFRASATSITPYAMFLRICAACCAVWRNASLSALATSTTPYRMFLRI
jgi:hypothetical protein